MLLNIVSIKIPIDTLTDGAFSGDALGWVVGLIVVIVILVFVQIWWMWRTGWFRFYACWLVLLPRHSTARLGGGKRGRRRKGRRTSSRMISSLTPSFLSFEHARTVACGLVIVVLSQLPDLTFRLHHYVSSFAARSLGTRKSRTRRADLVFSSRSQVFAIMFVPALGFATRPSLALQFLLLGICCDGVGKFGFESILETVSEVGRSFSSSLEVSLTFSPSFSSLQLQRDAALDTSIPTFITNFSTWANLTDGAFVNSSLLWNAIPTELASSWNGFSLLVDDVERYVGSGTSESSLFSSRSSVKLLAEPATSLDEQTFPSRLFRLSSPTSSESQCVFYCILSFLIPSTDGLEYFFSPVPTRRHLGRLHQSGDVFPERDVGESCSWNFIAL